jgi:hypothetical protein
MPEQCVDCEHPELPAVAGEWICLGRLGSLRRDEAHRSDEKARRGDSLSRYGGIEIDDDGSRPVDDDVAGMKVAMRERSVGMAVEVIECARELGDPRKHLRSGHIGSSDREAFALDPQVAGVSKVTLIHGDISRPSSRRRSFKHLEMAGQIGVTKL